jgi:hypothetical protein
MKLHFRLGWTTLEWGATVPGQKLPNPSYFVAYRHYGSTTAPAGRKKAGIAARF